jgi:hypothetical protein
MASNLFQRQSMGSYYMVDAMAISVWLYFAKIPPKTRLIPIGNIPVTNVSAINT